MLCDFITCQVEDNYSVLGDGTPEELQAAWLRLLSEFAEVSGDKRVGKECELRGKLEAITARATRIDLLLFSITILFTEECAEMLRDEYPDFKILPETIADEIVFIHNIEKRHKLEYDRMKLELENMQIKEEGKRDRQYFLGMMWDINKHEGGAGFTDTTMTAEYFAIGIGRIVKHNEEQANKDR